MTKNTPSSQERNDNPSTTEKTLNSNGGNLTAVGAETAYTAKLVPGPQWQAEIIPQV